LNAYCIAGPRTDHECSQYDELYEKLSKGMRIHIRLGSACRGIEELMRKVAENHLPTRRMLFCTDDKHLGDIEREGHINYILRRAVANGIPAIDAVQMATINAAETYGLLRYGAIAPGYRADMVLFDNLTDFNALMVFSNGIRFEPHPDTLLKRDPRIYNSVHLAPRKPGILDLKVHGDMPVINLVPGELLTNLTFETVPEKEGKFAPSPELLKAAVFERHMSSGRVGVGILKGMRLENGAIASTVGHDSHNLIVVGDNDEDMLAAVDVLESSSGGFVVVSQGKVLAHLPMPIAGLMSDLPLHEIISRQEALLKAFRTIGEYADGDPFVTLSFIALPVIPHVRITDMGVFHVTKMQFIQ
jgi:adenine deaminase